LRARSAGTGFPTSEKGDSTMKALIFFVLILLGVASYVALQYHFILIDDGLKILKKTEPAMEYTFVDGRGTINKARILVNPTLIQAGIQNIFSGEGITIRPKEQLENGLDSLKDQLK
jgi:hypothetical protein